MIALNYETKLLRAKHEARIVEYKEFLKTRPDLGLKGTESWVDNLIDKKTRTLRMEKYNDRCKVGIGKS